MLYNLFMKNITRLTPKYHIILLIYKILKQERDIKYKIIALHYNSITNNRMINSLTFKITVVITILINPLYVHNVFSLNLYHKAAINLLKRV